MGKILNLLLIESSINNISAIFFNFFICALCFLNVPLSKIVEQIIPFFKPEWTSTVKLIDGIDPIDIPLILNGITNEELYEGSFEERKSVLWTLNFTMKTWYFGPEQEKPVIKLVDTDLWTSSDTTKEPEVGVNVYPGLTANGSPETDPDLTIPYTDIEYNDDWGVVKVITEDPEAEV